MKYMYFASAHISCVLSTKSSQIMPRKSLGVFINPAESIFLILLQLHFEINLNPTNGLGTSKILLINIIILRQKKEEV